MAPSSSNQRAMKAITAMKSLGFPSDLTKPVLKSLLKESEHNWDYIEFEQYTALVDAILRAQESGPDPDPDPPESPAREVAAAATASPEPEQRLTRSRLKREGEQPAMLSPGTSAITPEKRPRVEPEVLLETGKGSFIKKTVETAGLSQQQQPLRRTEKRPELALPQTSALENARPALVQTYKRDKRALGERPDNLICLREPKIEPGLGIPPTSGVASGPASRCSDSSQFETPLAMIPPPPTAAAAATREDQLCGQGTTASNASSGLKNVSQLPVPRHADKAKEKEKGKGSSLVAACSSNGTTRDLAHSPQASSSSIDIASSPSGEVKLSFTVCTDRPGFQLGSVDDVIKRLEDRCLKSYKFLPPNFSFKNLLKEMCEHVSELGSESAPDKWEKVVPVSPTLDSLKKSVLHGMPGSSSNGPANLQGTPSMTYCPPNGNIESGQIGKLKDLGGLEAAYAVSNSLVAVNQENTLGRVRPPHDLNDISKGEERLRIPLANNFTSEMLPSSFYYIPNNTVYQNAYVNFSLARIGDEDCCPDCFGDCLSAPIPCACARETGGEFAYTLDGLLKKQFLDEYISTYHNPEKHVLFYCKRSCPLERIKNEVEPDSCKGHQIRKFIKECWKKCGCNKQCGNRVVQRGITCNLEVFFTGKGKGWGVRSLDELPEGTFVCEYVGEVLTNTELYERTVETTGNARHTYPVLLDADWGSEGVLKDEEALCLDATFYGNVARFINHRCEDANLIEIPVEVETPDRHYYHLAFFTTRKVEALEELTWDYGIDFDDDNHPIKAFRCRCRSKDCRDMQRTKTRSRK